MNDVGKWFVIGFFSLIATCAFGSYLDSCCGKEIAEGIKFAAQALAYSVGFGAVIALVSSGCFAIEIIRWRVARRHALERENGLPVVVTAGEREQVYIRETNKGITWQAAHLNPAHYRNGEQREPNAIELAAFQLWHSRPQAISAGNVPMLQAGQVVLPELLPILDRAQRCLIKAISDGGKTTLLQHIAYRRPGAVLIIDSQSFPGKWPERCKVVGTASNHAEITVVLDNLIMLMVQRYKEIGQGLVKEGQHPKLTVIIDEWMAIVDQCPNAPNVITRLLTESRKAAFSVFIGSHSERVKALGLDGRGDLREGFLIIRVWTEDNDERKATYDYGRGERACLLPGPYLRDDQRQSDGALIEIEKPVPSGQEQKVLELHENGESISGIAATIYGSKGGPQNARVQAILEKFGRV